MANPEHLKILKESVKAWNIWRVQDDAVPDLSGVNLGNADLAGVNFEGARLYGTMLNSANLKNARLAGARLTGCSFAAANLQAADLSHAALDYVSFLATNIASAKFFKSELGFTSFANTNLQRAENLETCLHLAPSSIDFGTLNRSGMLPKVFLQRCGWSDKAIELAESMYAKPGIECASCFISYSTEDDEFTRNLYARMVAAKIRVWYAPEDLKGGRKLHEQLFQAIQSQEKILLVLSEHSIESEWVKTEVRKARETEKNEKSRKLFPIRLTDFKTLREWTCFDADTGKDLAVEVREYFVPDFSNWKDHNAFEAAFARLQKDLEAEKPKQ